MKTQTSSHWNIAGFEREYKKYPRDLNFADKKSTLYLLKKYEKEIYFSLFSPYLKKLPGGSLILDAGCGVGRISRELLRRGCRVHLCDGSLLSLKTARKNLDGKKHRALFIHASVENLSMLPDEMYDAVFAVELLCYVNAPEKAMRELARVLKKSGLLFFSVENKLGALASERFITENNFISAYTKERLSVKDEVHVNYFTEKDTAALIKKAKMGTLLIAGCHYTADGIFGHLAQKTDLRNASSRKRLLEIENFCRKNKSLAPFARAWAAVARKR